MFCEIVVPVRFHELGHYVPGVLRFEKEGNTSELFKSEVHAKHFVNNSTSFASISPWILGKLKQRLTSYSIFSLGPQATLAQLFGNFWPHFMYRHHIDSQGCLYLLPIFALPPLIPTMDQSWQWWKCECVLLITLFLQLWFGEVGN